MDSGRTFANPKQLWVLELTAAEENRIGVPNVKLLGNMHGNEAAGREILLHFTEYLIDNYGILDSVTWLLNNTRIYVLPSLNPDGFEIAARTCDGSLGREVPWSNVDLNRHFRDFFEDNPLAKQDVKESAAIVAWMKKTPFILSAALHGGQLVANYPFDSSNSQIATESLTPDDDVFKYLAKTYSYNHPRMYLGKADCKNKLAFKDGITNGAKWYSFPGGMGDYNYAFHGCMELTLEIDCCKYPKERKLEGLWKENKESLLKFCTQANMGVTGQILDFDTRKPIERATLKIVGRDMVFRSSNGTGEFWRILLPGQYQLKVKANGYYDHTENFTVANITSGFPKLTVVTVLLYNSSTHTTTTTTTTTTQRTSTHKSVRVFPSTTIIPMLLSPRISAPNEKLYVDIPTPIVGMVLESSSNKKEDNILVVGMILIVTIYKLW